jgi:hypothetical protein
MVGTPLKLAIFWSLWNIWTVISPDRFRRPNGGLHVTMMEAVVASEFGKLGEVMIMTKAPLQLVLGAATNMPRSLSSEGLANFIIGSAKLYSGDVELTDPRIGSSRRSCSFTASGPPTARSLSPTVASSRVSSSSRLRKSLPTRAGMASVRPAVFFSRFYAAQTVDGDQIIQLHGEAAPDWFASLSDWDFKNSKLPLLLGRVQPSAPADGGLVEQVD